MTTPELSVCKGPLPALLHPQGITMQEPCGKSEHEVAAVCSEFPLEAKMLGDIRKEAPTPRHVTQQIMKSLLSCAVKPVENASVIEPSVGHAQKS